ncbi:Zinc finger protein 385B [Merluccius polli]|uniref:Zinc finger protein 385B n=1 Tax=Merluccius polli TaxID=89951 RepID=A0AA47NYE9_MERPO|nr:Zinc finger protein 385B [Merluccius polli]
MQSTLELNSMMSLPVETTSPVGLFPNFNTMDPVQKAVINHTFGVTMETTKRQVICCHTCQLRFNSQSQAASHYKGSRHTKRLKAQENGVKMSITGATNSSSSRPAGPAPLPSSATSNILKHTGLLSSVSPCSTRVGCVPLPTSPLSASLATPTSQHTPPTSIHTTPTSPQATPTSPQLLSTLCYSLPSPSLAPPPQAHPPDLEPHPDWLASEEEKAKKLLYCSLCKVAVNSLSQLDAHNTGVKHRTMLEARIGAGVIKSYLRPGSKAQNSSSLLKGSGLQNKSFHCQTCDVHVNSEVQLKQHISSRRHKDRVAGKPSKPKFSPYSKQHTTATDHVSVDVDLQRAWTRYRCGAEHNIREYIYTHSFITLTNPSCVGPCD